MLEFRVTKYNPKWRSKDGVFTKKEWTGICDIGRRYPDGIFKLSDYLSTEDAYVESVNRFLAASKVSRLKIKGREFNDSWTTFPASIRSETGNKLLQIGKKRVVFGDDLDWAVRLVLRECFWCRLEGEGGVFVEFSHDYYMFFGTDDDKFVMPLLPKGIYLEQLDDEVG